MALLPEQRENNKTKLTYLYSYVDELLSRQLVGGQVEKLHAILDMINHVLEEDEIVLEYEHGMERLKHLCLKFILTPESPAAFYDELKEWANAYKAESLGRDIEVAEIHASQPGIVRSLDENKPVDTVWGEDLDILFALRDEISSPEDMDQNGTYILYPDQSNLTVSLQPRIEEIQRKHANKDLRLLIPVSDQNHWRLFDIKLRQGKCTQATLWDSLEDPGLSNKSAYRNLKQVVDELILTDIKKSNPQFDHAQLSNEVRNKGIKVDAQALNKQHNGYSCMDYCLQTALALKYSSSRPTLESSLNILDARNAASLRQAIVYKIEENRAQAHVEKQIAKQPTNTIPTNLPAEQLETKLFHFLAHNKKQQIEFDYLMAKKVIEVFNQSNRSVNEETVFKTARYQAYVDYLKKYGLFSSSNKEQQVVDPDYRAVNQIKK